MYPIDKSPILRFTYVTHRIKITGTNIKIPKPDRASPALLLLLKASMDSISKKKDKTANPISSIAMPIIKVISSDSTPI
jgi:hypothetical protein